MNSSILGFREFAYRIFQSVCRNLISCVDLYKLLAALRRFHIVPFPRGCLLIPPLVLLDLKGIKSTLGSSLQECDSAGESPANHGPSNRDPAAVGQPPHLPAAGAYTSQRPALWATHRTWSRYKASCANSLPGDHTR